MKVSSRVEAAREAVSGFARIDVVQRAGDYAASAGASTVASMHDAAKAADRVLADLSALVTSVKEQAAKVTALATALQERDAEDARRMSGAADHGRGGA